ncbi:hypothetical protein OG21DRAFT_1491727 [Imleria badia]|nr:hypothetical protein OG21DRAFT_1491727 [Imleria badia]
MSSTKVVSASTAKDLLTAQFEDLEQLKKLDIQLKEREERTYDCQIKVLHLQIQFQQAMQAPGTQAATGILPSLPFAPVMPLAPIPGPSKSFVAGPFITSPAAAPPFLFTAGDSSSLPSVPSASSIVAPAGFPSESFSGSLLSPGST